MVNTRPSPSFGQLVRRYRQVAGLTQEALAERAGISARAVSDLERAMGRKPRRATVDRLVHALDLDATEIAALRSAAQLRGARPIPIKSVRKGQATSTHLPAEVTTLVGRDDDIAAVATLLQKPDVRLVTLTGVGGVGKTRVAVRVAQEVPGLFPDGVVFVALASVRNAGLVISTINAAVGVAEATDQEPLDALTASLRGKRALLVLDNVEQVRDAAPSLIDLLGRCLGVRILTTSRAMLRVRGEHVFVVQPLAVPDMAVADSKQEVMHYASVRLFVERAQAVMPGFALTLSNAPTVAAICARLDGLPLAIELAAARVNVLTPTALLARLDHRLSVLVGGARDAPERQQTLRDTLAWSYGLLTAAEQAFHRRLAVFVGGWSLNAASVVCGPEGTPADALAPVAALVDAHLAHVETRGDGQEPRFDMLDTVHEYAWDMLDRSGEAEATRRRHWEWCVSLAEEAEPHLKEGNDTATWLDRLETEHDNLRAALKWATEQATVTDGARLAGALTWFWYTRGHLREGRAWLEPMAARLSEGDDHTTPAIRARVLGGLGLVIGVQGEYGRAMDVLTSALALYRGLDDRQDIAYTLNSMGNIARLQADYIRAMHVLEEGLELYRAVGNRRGCTMALNNLGLVTYHRRDYARATALFGESLTLFLQVKDFKPLSRAFLQLLSRTNAYRVAQTHEAYSEATAVCGSKGLVEARRLCRYAPFATPSGGHAGT